MFFVTSAIFSGIVTTRLMGGESPNRYNELTT